MNWSKPNYYGGMRWSPDGSELLMSVAGLSKADQAFDLQLYDYNTGNTSSFVATSATERRPHWSPTGEWTVFISYQDSKAGSELVFAKADASCLIQEAVM